MLLESSLPLGCVVGLSLLCELLETLESSFVLLGSSFPHVLLESSLLNVLLESSTPCVIEVFLTLLCIVVVFLIKRVVEVFLVLLCVVGVFLMYS